MNTKSRQWILIAILMSMMFTATQDRYLMARLFRRSGASSVKWHSSFEEAQATATREKRPIFVDFSATWCQPCQEMLHETYTDPDVVRRLNENFVPVQVDVDRRSDLAARFGVSPIPDAVFLAPDGERQLNRSIGFHDADSFLLVISTALKAAAAPAPPASASRHKPSPFGTRPPLPPIPPDLGLQ